MNNNQEQQSPAVEPGRKGGNKQAKQRKPNPQRADARASFNAAAAPIPVGEVFKSFTWVHDHNVDVTLDLTVVDRIAEPYMRKARDYGQFKLGISPAEPADGIPDRRKDAPATVYAMSALAIARKLLVSVPNSELNDVGTFKFIAQQEYHAPQSVINAAEHLGKFELDDKKARIRYNSQDVARILAMSCKVMNLHSDFAGRYDVPGHIRLGNQTNTRWADVDVTKIVTVTEASVRWMRDEGVKKVSQAYETDFAVRLPVQGGIPVEIQVNYPRLPISNNPDAQLRNVLAWLNKLNVLMPRYAEFTAAAFATCWKKIWFERPNARIQDLQPGVPAAFVATPADILRLLGLTLWDIELERTLPTTAAAFALRIYEHVLSSTYLFSGFANLVKQPTNQFGSPAQFIVYDDQDYVQEPIVGLEEVVVRKLKRGARALVLTEAGDRGAIAAGMLFGFAKSVVFVHNFETNGENLNQQLQRYFAGDIKMF